MTSHPPTTFGERLRWARKARGYLRQEDLADRIGVSLKTVNRHETSADAPRAARTTIEAYAAALEVSELWLVHGLGEGPQGKDLPPAVEHYLVSPPLGGPVDSEAAALLRDLDWSSVGSPNPTVEEVHDVRKMIEALVRSRRQRGDADLGG
jgi:transcriptional regulator with XRE-family HTH domain